MKHSRDTRTILWVAMLGLAIGVLTPAIVRADPAVEDRDAADLERLDLLFGTKGPLPPPLGTDVVTRVERLRAFLRDRMAQNELYDTILPRLFPLVSLASSPMPFKLVRAQRDGRDYYYLAKDKDCDAKDLVEVRPWWDLATPIRVCKASYRPELTADERAGSKQYCEANYSNSLPPKGICRCGRYLLNCEPAGDFAEAHDRAYLEEPLRLMQRVITERRRFSEVLTTTDSAYADVNEIFYARDRFFRTGKLEMAKPDPTLAARPRHRAPEFAGGILTTPSIIFWDPSRRTTLSYMWTSFLCTTNDALGVRAKQIVGLSSGTLRETGFNALAAMVGCRDCHARLENAWRAFDIFSLPSNGVRLLPRTLPPPTITFFVHDSTDARGRGPATPAWIGQMLSTQPEFVPCVVRKIEQLVYGGYPPPRVLDEFLLERFRRNQDFSDVLERAVIAHEVSLAAAVRDDDASHSATR